MGGERREVIGVVIHIVSVAGLARSPVTSPIMGDDAIAMIQEKHHLGIPVSRTQWPAMTENNRLSVSPILVIDLCSVFCRDRRHNTSPFGRVPGKNLRGIFGRVYSVNSTASRNEPMFCSQQAPAGADS